MAQILLVVISEDRREALADLLGGRGHEVVATTCFEDAVGKLSEYSPDLIISDVRLAAYNAVHLVIRSRETHPHMRAILLDRARDPVLEAEAQRQGAAYLVEPVGSDDLLAEVANKLARPRNQRRWSRKQPEGGLPARVAHRLGRVVDLSYGGLRLEVPETRSDELSSIVDVNVPLFGLTVRATPVWTRPAASGLLWCGAAVEEANRETVLAWRRLVDSVSNAV